MLPYQVTDYLHLLAYGRMTLQIPNTRLPCISNRDRSTASARQMPMALKQVMQTPNLTLPVSLVSSPTKAPPTSVKAGTWRSRDSVATLELCGRFVSTLRSMDARISEGKPTGNVQEMEGQKYQQVQLEQLKNWIMHVLCIS